MAIEDKAAEASNMDAIGSTGLKQWAGFVDEEFLASLKGPRGVATYREMGDNDPIVGVVLYVIGTLMKQAEWWIEPSDENNPEAVKEAEWLETALQDMSHTWEELLDEVMSMLLYGWSYFETVYKVRRGPDEADPRYRSDFEDGRFGWRKIELRSQDSLYRWEFDPEDSGMLGMWQAPEIAPIGKELVFIPIERCLLFRTRKFKNNPEGRSLFRNAVRSWYFLKRIQELEAIGVERDLAGLPMFEVPVEILSRTAGPAQVQIRQLLEKLVQSIRRDEREGLLVPASEVQGPNGPVKTGYKFSLVQGTGKRQLDTNEIITRYETRIAMVALMEFIMNGTDGRTGSRSLVSSKTELFAMALGAMLKGITSVFNRFAIPRLMKLNNVPRELRPKLCHGDIETPPLDEIAAYITAMAQAGFTLTTNRKLERKLHSFAKLPPPEDGETTADIQEARAAEQAAADEQAALEAAAAGLPPPPKGGAGGGGPPWAKRGGPFARRPGAPKPGKVAAKLPAIPPKQDDPEEEDDE